MLPLPFCVIVARASGSSRHVIPSWVLPGYVIR